MVIKTVYSIRVVWKKDEALSGLPVLDSQKIIGKPPAARVPGPVTKLR